MYLFQDIVYFKSIVNILFMHSTIILIRNSKYTPLKSLILFNQYHHLAYQVHGKLFQLRIVY